MAWQGHLPCTLRSELQCILTSREGLSVTVCCVVTSSQLVNYFTCRMHESGKTAAMLPNHANKVQDSSRRLETNTLARPSRVENENKRRTGSAVPNQRSETGGDEFQYVPAKSTCQCYFGSRCGRTGSFVDNVPQGPGLCFTDNSGYVSIMQKTCGDETTGFLSQGAGHQSQPFAPAKWRLGVN